MKKGLTNSTTATNWTYLKVMEGEFRESVAPGTPGAETRLDKNEKEVSELIYTEAIGKITRALVKDAKFGKELHITISNGGEHYIIQTPASSGYAYGFFSRMKTIDLTKEVKVNPYYIENKKDGIPQNTFKAILSFYQRNEAGEWTIVPSSHSKENPNGCPELEVIMVKGKEQWDSSKRILFFEKEIKAVTDTLESMYPRKQEETAVAPPVVVDLEEEEVEMEASKPKKKMAAARK